MAGNLSDISNESNEKTATNPRLALYKNLTRTNNYRDDSRQEIRRQRLLWEQKKNRDATFDSGRALLDEALQGNDCNDEGMEVQQDETWRSPRRVQKYANQLMMSEWMLEIPSDLAEKWLMVPCPQGRRVLLIASKGMTVAYNKRGVRLGKFSSTLPGGTYQDYKNRCTILDCIWDKDTKTYYTLDVLAWSNQALLDCDTEFRFFWLKTRLEETQGLTERGSLVNSYPILSLPNYPCDSDAGAILDNLSSLPPLDGLLFYHREAHYTHGRTPLVNWLKPFMLSDVFGLQFPPDIYEKPPDYVDIKSYIRKKTTTRRKNKGTDDLMEITSAENVVEMA
ncbi:snurportin-1 [Neodiprion lecontei]|uniref:Snurportin-1 n=1 Tax=Neodiprion lecontei TaxID=441921 RepID=A0A6J0B9S3_NEOLC|nr:snurportin-1 [Neodiprion lecontei]